MYHSLSISGLLTLDLHALNNEGAEGNTMMTRMVDIIDRKGVKHTVNAVSGDMFKHIFVGHLLDEAKRSGLPLCQGCQTFNPNRIQADTSFMGSFEDGAPDPAVLTATIQKCVIDDCAGILLTGKIGNKNRSIARKSCVEFGWAVGRPEATTTDSYFHAKYVPDGRGEGSGEGANLGQNIFHRPASSGQYAVVVNVDLYKVGRNDITLQYDLGNDGPASPRSVRATAVLRSLVSALVKPTGAHRNTQNPHVVDFTGVIATSTSSVPAPSISALNPDFQTEVQRIAAALNSMNGHPSIEVRSFDSLGDFAGKMADIVADCSR